MVYFTSFSTRNGCFWQQNITQVRKSFITQSKLMIFWWIKKFLKALIISFYYFPQKIELHFGWCGSCWPSFCPNRVLVEDKFFTASLVFFSELQYDNISYINSMSQHISLEISQKNVRGTIIKGKIWPNSAINKAPLIPDLLCLGKIEWWISRIFTRAVQSITRFFAGFKHMKFWWGFSINLFL